jgi:hypothetical protein
MDLEVEEEVAGLLVVNIERNVVDISIILTQSGLIK